MEAKRRQRRLDDINAQIKERTEYLTRINDDIDAATIVGADRLRELAGEVTELEEEKARLMKQNLGLEQRIRENKLHLARE